jgi:AMMECR1 domain-containing protein
MKIVPLFIGRLSQDDASKVAQELVDCSTCQTLIVLSADLAHHKNMYEDCPLDQSMVCKIYDSDSYKVQEVQSRALHRQVDVFDDCHASSIFILLFELLKLLEFKNIQSYFVGYDTSFRFSDATQSELDTSMSTIKSRCVEDIESYASFIFQHHQFGYKNQIGHYERSQLLQCARLGLDSLFEVSACRLPCMVSYEMSQPYGVFSSLYCMSDHGTLLRGCMGRIESKLPLYKMVYQMTKQAGCKDLRFCSLKEKEANDAIISLSVIVDLKKIHDYTQIQALDGVLLQYDDKLAISLPAIKPEPFWNYKSVLIKLSDQIGIPGFSWNNQRAKISVFRSLTFQEE